MGIPTLYWYGKEHGYSTLVIDVLGPSLCDLLRYCEGKFTLKTVLMIAEQAIQRLESIHSRGFVYRDVSPSNLLIGMGSKTDKIYLVDFELAERYTDIEGGHLAFGPSESRISKDLRFLSVHAHLRVKQSRRDDLESLGYVLIYFLNGTLPWSDISEENKELESLLIKERKVSCPIEVLCKGLPSKYGSNIDQLGQYFKYAKTLEYEEEPDYQWIQRLLKDLFAECGFESNLIFDWAQNYHDKENKL